MNCQPIYRRDIAIVPAGAWAGTLAYKLPGSIRCWLHAATLAYVTDATVAGRIPLIRISNAAGQLVSFSTSGFAMTQSKTWTAFWGPMGMGILATDGSGGGSNAIFPFPLAGDDTITMEVISFAAGDTAQLVLTLGSNEMWAE